jgi:predicted permease
MLQVLAAGGHRGARESPVEWATEYEDATMARFLSLWRNLVHRDRVERDLDDEVRTVFDLLIDEKIQAGLRPEEARRAATLELAPIETIKDRVRDVRAGALVDTVVQDLRYAARLLRRNPLFALTAALSIAIGIGANTTIFSAANALLFRAPVGVTDPDRVVDIGVSRGTVGFNPGSYPNYLDIAERATTLDGVYASQLFGTRMTLGSNRQPDGVETIFCTHVTLNYFNVLGAVPAAGRLFGAGDGPPVSPKPDAASTKPRDSSPARAERADSREPSGDSPVVVMSHRFWSRRFNRDPTIVGGTVLLNGQSFSVVGVTSEGFRGTRILAPDVWMPITTSPSTTSPDGPSLTSRAGGSLVMGGRLKPGVSMGQAAAELNAIGRALEREYPDQNRGKGLRVLPASPVPGASTPVAIFLALLMGVVTLVLMVACANVAGILLARAAARRREIAVRLAIGAGRARLVRQLLTETVLLFALAGAAGLLLARWMTSLVVAVLPVLPFPVEISLSLDSRVLAFTTGLSLVAAILSGLAPALQASKADVVTALKDDAQGATGRSRLRHAFVVAQVAFSLVVVVAAGLFVRWLQAGSQDPGFDPHGVELATVDLSPAGYTDITGPVFARDLMERVRALPGVESATIARVLPGGFEGIRFGLGVPGVAPPNGERFFSLDWNIVEPGYFATLRIPLVAGRDFSAGDDAGAPPVAILDEGTARRFWPGQNAIGKFLQQVVDPVGSTGARTLMVIGVVRDIKSSSLVDGLAEAFVYVPLQQQYGATRALTMTIAARTTRGQRIAGEIRTLVASMNPSLPIVRSQTLDDSVALGLVPQRVAVSVSSSLGIVGLLLAAIGIYGVTAYAVTRRTREIGIRMALGAHRADVVRLVLGQGMSLAFVGCAIGLILAAAVNQVLAGFLYGIPPMDPAVFGGAAALFIVVGMVACYVPVRRATRINAMEALRYE